MYVCMYVRTYVRLYVRSLHGHHHCTYVRTIRSVQFENVLEQLSLGYPACTKLVVQRLAQKQQTHSFDTNVPTNDGNTGQNKNKNKKRTTNSIKTDDSEQTSKKNDTKRT